MRIRKHEAGLAILAAAEVLAFVLLSASPSEQAIVTGSISVISTLVGFGLCMVMTSAPSRRRPRGRARLGQR